MPVCNDPTLLNAMIWQIGYEVIEGDPGEWNIQRRTK